MAREHVLVPLEFSDLLAGLDRSDRPVALSGDPPGPAEQALQCEVCGQPVSGRLAAVASGWGACVGCSAGRLPGLCQVGFEEVCQPRDCGADVLFLVVEVDVAGALDPVQ